MISMLSDFESHYCMKKIAKICGQKLKFITYGLESKKFKKIFKFNPNIETIYYQTNDYSLNEIYFSKLREILFSSKLDFNLFKTFTSLYHKQIENISLKIDSNVRNFLEELSRFERLEKLRISFPSFPEPKEEFENLFEPNKSGFILIGSKCKVLKNLIINGEYLHIRFSKDNNLCEIFSQNFHALQKLTLILDLHKLNHLNIEPLKNCKDLKFLELNIQPFEAKAIKDIELNLPNLKTIIIYLNSDFNLNPKIFQSLAKSKSLTRLVINITDVYQYESFQIFESLINDVLKTCFKIREIYFDGKQMKLTRNTMDLLESYTKNNFKFDYDFNNKLKMNEKFSQIEIKERQFYNLYIKNW
jgi:hypothetical protein